MERSKPTQNHEQKQPTPEYDVVKNFPTDTTNLDSTRYPLTIIRSGQDGEDVKRDEGWYPSDMSAVVFDAGSKNGIGQIKLLMEVYKVVKAGIETELVPLEDIQGLGADEGYIEYLYGKTPEKMIEEAKRILRQKHPDSDWNELLDVKVPSETPSDGLDAEGNSEKSLKDEVSSIMGNLAVKTVEVSPVKTDKAGVGSPALVMTKKEVPASIGAVKVNDSVSLPAVKPVEKPAVRSIGIKKPVEADKVGANPADLVATEPVKKPVEADRASADLVDLPAAKSVENPVVEKSMETNEANTDILPEDFKSVMNDFEKDTKENNGKFFAKVQYITGELDRFRGLIKYNPTAAMNDPVVSEMITSEPDRIRNLEDSRAEDANKFKNNINDILEDLKKKIKNDDERRRLVKLTEHVDQMGVNNTVLGEVTNGLLNKLIRIRRYIEGWQNDRWGADGYKSNISQVIGEIISDLSTASEYRRGIVGGIEGIKSEGYHQKR
ncbi:hypothetical protein MBN60_01880 [Candidatus Saccharibacteria bacterium]|nr:hypothetical protein [Candidatus Saccharibacteria bacterium]